MGRFIERERGKNFPARQIGGMMQVLDLTGGMLEQGFSASVLSLPFGIFNLAQLFQQSMPGGS